ncbi:MAG: (2Fe-2S)-binding protein [Deltaproteobacteria bacterium]|nr:(2Fe-2S)-binding protein [Deltaproteobacteria bacterium]MBW2396006.1 (2Fe-2S)-binding protein [Deltaproteobacteria bacterium]
MSEQPRITLGGSAVVFEPGETLLDVARRNGVEIPTLCHDPRLKPAGACRTCLVEIEGWQRLAPACATRAQAGMVVASENERIDRHRKSLLALYMTDHPQTDERAETGTPNQLLAMAEAFAAPSDWGRLPQKRAGRPEDRNPYIHYEAETCILCARCTRYCDEIESVSAITLAGRGSETTISTADELSLLDTTCEMCGGCIDVCPTGAMSEKMPLALEARPDRALGKVRTTCNYCGVGCQLDLNVDRAGEGGRGRIVKVTSPEPGTTSNDGNLCVKGRFAYEFVHHGDRLTKPLVRGKDGELRETSWEDALQVAAEGLMGVRERHGADGLGFVSSSRCTVEENYLVQKLARVVFGTNNVHQCAAT